MKISYKGEFLVIIFSVIAAVGGNYAVDKFFPNLAMAQDYVYSVTTGILLAIGILITCNFKEGMN